MFEQATATKLPWKAELGAEDEPTRWVILQDNDPPWLVATIENGAPGDTLETEAATAALIVEAVNNHERLTKQNDRLAAIKRLLLNVLEDMFEFAKEDWVRDKAVTAISNAKLIEDGTYRPGVFMPSGSEVTE